MPGNEFDRRRWRKQGEFVGAAVKIARAVANKAILGTARGVRSTKSPSAPAKTKALKPCGFRAFSFIYRTLSEFLKCVNFKSLSHLVLSVFR